MIEQQIKAAIRDVPDFPKPGIVFKDITTILKDHVLCEDIIDAFVERLKGNQIDAVAGVESRGFLFGLTLANRLRVPFIPIRKAGKLPYSVKQKTYDLEYGTATIEMHIDAFEPGARILLHDDLLATGGTVIASSELIEELGGRVCGFTFIVELGFLNGRDKIAPIHDDIIALATY
jgi:adenine phosphoribosyltransferase